MTICKLLSIIDFVLFYGTIFTFLYDKAIEKSLRFLGKSYSEMLTV